MLLRRPSAGLGTLFVNPTYNEKLTAFLIMGGIGGLFLGYQGFQHFFVEGVTTKERRDILIFAAGMVLWWGLDQAFNLQKQMDEWQVQVAQKVGLP